MNLRIKIQILISAIALFVSSTAFAQLTISDGGASGQWFNPQRNGEGIYFEVIRTDSATQVAMAWFTYDTEGFQLWLIGNVEIPDDATSVTMPVIVTAGAKFGDAFKPEDVQRATWGTVTLTFDTCSHGLLSYASSVEGFGTGAIELTRLTNLKQVQCTDPPPSPGSGIAPGRWNGDGVCFNVSEDGRTLTSNGSGCLGGRAFDLEINSTDQNGHACKVVVECTGFIAIVDNGFTCNSGKGEAIALGSFVNGSTATGAAQQVEGSSICTAHNWKALPQNP